MALAASRSGTVPSRSLRSAKRELDDPQRSGLGTPPRIESTALPTAAFTSGRLTKLVTDRVDLFAQDLGTADVPTGKIWKIDMVTGSATAVDVAIPSGMFFLGADQDALYFLGRSETGDASHLHEDGRRGAVASSRRL